MKFFVLIMLFCLHASGHAKDDKFACNPADPGWGIDSISKWAAQMDQLGSSSMRSGDILTRFGNPVDETCVRKLTPKQVKARLERMEEGMAYAMTQAQRCWANLGFAETTGIISKLRRTKFNCANTRYGANAKVSGKPNCDHRYELEEWGAYMNSSPIEYVGSTLFHEALHWSVANNRKDHASAGSKERQGCKNSLFIDRVYLMEAACFPLSDVGEAFYDSSSGAVNCPGICEKALTQGQKNIYADETLYGHNYKPSEARIICERIRNVPKDYQKSRNELKKIMDRKVVMEEFGWRKLGISPDGMKLRTLLNDAFVHSEEAYDPNSSLSEIRKKITATRNAFITETKAACHKEKKETYLQIFCKDYSPEKNPFIEEMDRLNLGIENVKVSEFNLFTKAKKVK